MSEQRLSGGHSSVLDFLRATAVSLVVIDHILEIGRFAAFRWLAVRVGWLGVLMFFVHTSLVLMFSLERTRAAGTSLLKHFYLRRAFRIYPLAIVVILVVVAFQVPVATIRWHLQTLSPSVLIGNLLLVQNLFYIPVVLGPLWSLPLELQMYVLLPFIFWFVRRGTRLDNAVLLVLGFIGLACLQPYVTGRANVLQFSPCFMGGVIAYCLAKRRVAVWPFWLWTIVIAGSMVGFVLLAQVDIGGEEPIVVSWALGLLLGSLVPSFEETKSRILRVGSATIAKYSYGIYLTHMLAFRFAFGRVFPTHYAAASLLGVALTVPLAYLAYHLVESPCVDIGSRLALRFLNIPGATADSAAVSSVPLSS